MLENLSPERRSELSKINTPNVGYVKIFDCDAGDVIKVTDTAGNCYLLEVTQPDQCRARVVRCGRPNPEVQTQYLGPLEVSKVIAVGMAFHHGRMITLPLTSVAFVSPQSVKNFER